MDMNEVRTKAKELFQGACRVCKVCDGKACIGETPGMGGCGTASSFHNNYNSLKNVRLNLRLIHDVREPNLAISFLGMKLDMPLLIAPIGGISYNMKSAIPEDAYIKAIVDGAKECGILGTTGDGVPDIIHESGYKAIAEAHGFGIPFIKPWEGKEFDMKFEKALATNCPAIGMDIDAAGLITLALQGRPVSPKSVEELTKIVNMVHAKHKKFILKGIMTVEDAKNALKAGCDAIVVSNHGGRVLDHTPGTAEVLPHIAKEVKGKTTIIVDGAIRDGFDILKMLALGADVAMIGRPYSLAAVGGQKEGVVLYTKQLKSQLTQAMVLTGTNSVTDVNATILA